MCIFTYFHIYIYIYIIYIYINIIIHSLELKFHGILLPCREVLFLRQERYLDFKRELDGALEKFRFFM